MFKKLNILMLGLSVALMAVDQPNEPLSKQSWSYFGELRKAYVAGRKGYPEDVFTTLKRYVKSNASIVDLGSGTGISTRQLCQHGYKNVIGVDRDLLMIKEAEAANTKDCHIQYIEGDVSKRLPFPDESYDAATSFASFHWFSNPSSIKEVARILKPQGYFFIVRSDDKSANEDSLKKKINELIEKEIGQTIPSKSVNPAASLAAQGFEIIVDSTVTFTNDYTVDEYFNNIQSKSSWNFVKNTPHEENLIKKIKEYLEREKDAQGHIKEKKTLRMVLGQKKVL